MAEEKVQKAEQKEKKPFQYIDNYPDPKSIFKTKLNSIENVKNEAVVVLDTNALLAPFGASSHSLEQIAKVYRSLKESGRLIVPGHVAREFAENRTNRLEDIHHQLITQKQVAINVLSTPLLMGDDDYQLLLEKRAELDRAVSDYKKLIDKILSKVKGWRWDDPVSALYSNLFGDSEVFDIEFEKDALLKEMILRGENNMPSGYKDLKKIENSAGDFIIWKTILEIGRKQQSHIIFVTNDGKPDWWSQADGGVLYPRFELIVEYSAASEGKHPYFIKLSELLQLYDAEPESISEIQAVEKDTKEDAAKIVKYKKYATENIIRDLNYAEYNYEVANDVVVGWKDDKNLIFGIYYAGDDADAFSELPALAGKLYNQMHNGDIDGKIIQIVIALFDFKDEARFVYTHDAFDTYPENTAVVYADVQSGYFRTFSSKMNLIDKELSSFLRGLDLPF